MTVPSENGSEGAARPEGESLFSGVRWVAIGQVASQVLRLVITVVLARLLAPEDFGLLAMATAFTTLATLLSTLGIGPVIVQRPSVSEELLRSLAGIGLADAGALADHLVSGRPISLGRRKDGLFDLCHAFRCLKVLSVP